MFPGLDGSASLRAGLIRRLRDHSVVHCIDYAGVTGATPLAVAAEVADRFPPSVVLLAESFGGPLAVLAASLRPANVAGIMLCASFLWLPAPPLSPWLATWLARGCRGLPAAALGWALLNRSEGPEVRALRQVLQALPPTLLGQRLQWLSQIDARDAILALRCPMHMVQAADDRLLRWMPSAWPERATQSAVSGPHALWQMRADVIAAEFAQFRTTLRLP